MSLKSSEYWFKNKELLELIPGTKVKTIERCSGHDGTWGIKTEFFKDSMKIGKPVFKAAEQFNPDYISSDCALLLDTLCKELEKTQKRILKNYTQFH